MEASPSGSQPTAPPGLEGVAVAETALGGVRGDEGFYHYRQYSAVELAASRSIEDVWFLLLYGRLPGAEESARFRSEIAFHRVLDPDLVELVARCAVTGEEIPALSWVRTGVSVVAQGLGLAPWLGTDQDELRREAIRLAAAVPTVVAVGWRARQGLEPVPSEREHGLAEDLLWMLTGRPPRSGHASALERYLTLTVDHGFNASTFTARVVASTGADLGAGLVAAIGALSGPLHGGAPTYVLEMLEEIGTADQTRSWVEAALARGDRIMGFGHRVYRTEDPRSAALKETALGLGGPMVELAVAAEATILDVLERHRPDRQIRTNVEYYAGVVLDLVGIPGELFPACFAVSRSIGWTAQMLEQVADNRIYRPKSSYTGPPPPEPVPE